MLQFIIWYITITILGLLTFPLAYRLLPALADRGYALSRSLGLLIWAFVFWLAVSLGISQNTVGGLLLALAVLVGLSVWANWRAEHKPETTEDKQPSTFNFKPVLDWLKSNLRYVLSVEILFLIAFAVWAFVRANSPEIISSGGEKWMEVAFINAILRSPTFPPHDPWLSGYAISYYYFGYVMTAMLAEITSTAGSVAFNLMLALIFGLSAIGSYGLLYNLLRAYWQSRTGKDKNKNSAAGNNLVRALWGAFLAPLFMIVLGNWEALLGVLQKRGIGWTGNPGDVNLWTNLGVGYPPPEGTSAAYNFWTWLDILDLKDKPQPVFGGVLERLSTWWSSDGFNGLGKWFIEAFMPNQGGWWWWRASRVVTDYDLRGGSTEIIDEFPAFSYLLGDLHPHVLAMPFALLLGALALNLYLGGWKGQTNLFKLKLSNDFEFELKFPVRLEGFILLAVTLGGLAFLNTWAFPMYLGLACIALVLMLVQERGWSWDLLEDFLKFSIPLAALSVVLYLPFYIGFSSQAGGILPNVIFPTRGAHLWVMFGGLFVPMLAFLVYLWRKEDAAWQKGFWLAIGFTLFLWAFSTILGIAAANTDVGQQFISSQGLSSTGDVLREAFLRRLTFGGGLLTLLLLIGGAAAYLTAKSSPQGAIADASTDITSNPASGRSPMPFVLMFILFGGLLVLAPDFVFLRDQFVNRMNTVFKFYYEAWALWSIAAAFAVVVMLSELRSWVSGIYTAVVVALIGIGLLFPVLGVLNRTNNFQADDPQQRTLDGAAYRAQVSPDDTQAILWLQSAPMGIIAEAVKLGSYNEYARVSTFSGLPTVLGWDGHESQWRGGNKEMGTRQADIQMLYITRDWAQAQAILKQYDIHYVYIGPLERETYHVYDEKFIQHLSPVYNQGQVVIYVVP
jgi:YYY domain-containing protein